MGLFRETDQKTSLSRFTLHGYGTAVSLKDPVHNVKPHARSLTNTFRGKERIENTTLNILGDARAIIFKLKADVYLG